MDGIMEAVARVCWQRMSCYMCGNREAAASALSLIRVYLVAHTRRKILSLFTLKSIDCGAVPLDNLSGHVSD